MMILFQLVAIVALASLSTQCSRDQETVNRQSNGSTPPANVSASVEDEVKQKEISKDLVASFHEAIKRESLKLRIGNLKDTRANEANEMRIWVFFGTLYPRIFIMRAANGTQQAFHITAKATGNGTPRKISMPKLSLAAPKSGWNSFAEFLKDHGIDSPMKLSLDKRYEPDPDEEAIAIEVKSGAKYEMVFYKVSTRSEDGNKALEVCRRVEQEFGIMMGCG